MPKPCANFCGDLLNGVIYVAGGIETPTATNALKTFWSLDLSAANPQWTKLEPWPGPARMLATAGVLNGSFYLFGGAQLHADAQGKAVREYRRDAYAFTPGKGWRQLADLPAPMVAPPTPAIASAGRLLIFSGDDGSKVNLPQSPQHPGFSRETLAYDPDKDSWSIVGQVPFSRATTTAVEWRGHVVIPMGEVRPRERTPEVWWAKLPSSP
jgi:N-acetylneuraminic acid mutarotase